VTVRRDGRVVHLKPVHSTLLDGSYKLGFEFGLRITSSGHPLLAAPGLALDDMWRLTTGTLGAIGNVVTPQGRSQLHSAVGIVSVSADEVNRGAGYYLTILAYVSLSLAIFNLLPFLPLDGGHIFLIALERLRGRMVSRAHAGGVRDRPAKRPGIVDRHQLAVTVPAQHSLRLPDYPDR
jgi:regulator of sigma E protease